MINDLKTFLYYCKDKGLAEKTIYTYQQTICLFINYLQTEKKIKDWDSVKTKDLYDYIAFIRERGKYTVVVDIDSIEVNHPLKRNDKGKTVSDTTINNYLRNIRVFFNWLFDYEYINQNPINKLKYIKTARKPLYFLTNKEYNMFMKSFNCNRFSEYRDYIIVETLQDTGMRIGECLSIKIDDVDFSHNTIYLRAENTKGKKSRFVFFSSYLNKDLRKWIRKKDKKAKSDLLFCTNRGTKVSISQFERSIRIYQSRAGLTGIHPHVFRNNFAKRFLMSGGDIYTLSRILGHSSIKVTEEAYLDLDTDDLAKQYAGHSPLTSMRKKSSKLII